MPVIPHGLMGYDRLMPYCTGWPRITTGWSRSTMGHHWVRFGTYLVVYPRPTVGSRTRTTPRAWPSVRHTLSVYRRSTSTMCTFTRYSGITGVDDHGPTDWNTTDPEINRSGIWITLFRWSLCGRQLWPVLPIVVGTEVHHTVPTY